MEQLLNVKKPKSFIKLVGQSLDVSDELRALVYHLIHILELVNSASVETLENQLMMKNILLDSSTLEFYLDLGISSGFFKKMRTNNIVLYALNTKKRKEKVKGIKPKAHTRPNRGLGKSIVNALNGDKIDKLFHVPALLTLLQDAYPNATVRNIEANLKLIHRKQPNQLILDNGLYLIKGKINYLEAIK